MFVSGVPTNGRCGGYLPVHFGDTVRKNTLSIEFEYNKEQVTLVMLIMLITCVAR